MHKQEQENFFHFKKVPRSGFCRFSLWTSLLFATSFAGLNACQSSNEPKLPVLKSIEIEGNKGLSDGKIQDKLALRESSWFPFFGGKQYFDASVLPQDLQRVERIYETQGYYGSRVTNHEVTQTEKEARLKIWVQEGPAIKVDTVNIEGFSKEELPELPLEVGEKFDEALYIETKNAIRSHLLNNGYPYPEVEGNAVVNPASAKATVTFRISSGNKYTLSDVQINGAQEVDQELVREIIGIEKGQMFKESTLAETQRKLYELGVFRLVDVKLGEADIAEGTVPVIINVDEGPFHTIGLGGGVGLENNRQEVRARLLYRHSNFFGGLRRFETELRPAYIMVPSFYDPEKQGFGGQATASLFHPEFLHNLGAKNLGWTNSIEVNRDIQDGFIVTTGNFRTGVIWPTNSRSTLEAGYNFELFSLANMPAQVRQCPGVCKLSYFDQRFVLDRRDSATAPRKGYWGSLSLQEAGLLTGDFDYVRVVPEARGYIPLDERLSLATRLQAGAFFPKKGTQSPIPKRFYAGGPASHRGFGLRRLSPNVPSGGKRDIPIGGESLFIANAEIRYDLTENLATMVFGDTGDVQAGRKAFQSPELNHAAGLGLRYETPVVPVRLDLGYRINTPERFEKEPRFAFHLTLGDSF